MSYNNVIPSHLNQYLMTANLTCHYMCEVCYIKNLGSYEGCVTCNTDLQFIGDAICKCDSSKYQLNGVTCEKESQKT